MCTGLASVSTPLRNFQQNGDDDQKGKEKRPIAVVEGVNYKVVWSCLLLVEMIMTNLSAAAYFQQSLATNAVAKVVEAMRLFNARATNLVLGAGAIHSAARLKSINAKHLSYVTQCLGMTIALLPHIRAALMAQLPPKQHALLADLDSIKNEYKDHSEKVLNKFVSIIGGIVEHGLAPRIAGTNFDERAQNQTTTDDQGRVECFVYLDGVSSSTRKLHSVLNQLLPPDHLQDVFSRIFAHLDQQIPALFVAAASTNTFLFPFTDAGKHRLVLEVAQTTQTLNGLAGVLPWDFTAINVLERKLDYRLPDSTTQSTETTTEEQATSATNENEESVEDTEEEPVSEQEVSTEVADRQNGDKDTEGKPVSEQEVSTEAADRQNNDEGTEEKPVSEQGVVTEAADRENGDKDTEEKPVSEQEVFTEATDRETGDEGTEEKPVSEQEVFTEAADRENGDAAVDTEGEAKAMARVEEQNPPPEGESIKESAVESNGESPTSNGCENTESAASDSKGTAVVNGESLPSPENETETNENNVNQVEE